MLVLDDLEINGYKIYQDDELYRFTSDSVLLSHFASVKKGDVVADFCSGSGIVGINLYAYNTGVIKSVTLFEMQKPLFDLSEKTIEYNKLQDKISAVNCKIQDINNAYNEKFSLIVCNPPYMKVEAGEGAENQSKRLCKSEQALPLEDLIKKVAFTLKFGGRIAMCHRADRLCDIIYQMKQNKIEPKRIRFVCAKGSDQPYLLLIEGVKGGKPSVKIESTVEN